MSKYLMDPVAMRNGSQACGFESPEWVLGLRRFVTLLELDSVSISRPQCHWTMSRLRSWVNGLGCTVRRFRSPVCMRPRSSQGRYSRRLTARLRSWSLVNLRMALGISVNLFWRRLRTLSSSRSKTSLQSNERRFWAKYNRRKGSRGV